MYSNQTEAKKAGWFSRRHETMEGLVKGREARKQKFDHKKEVIERNKKLRSNRTAKEQLIVLDKRLGKGQGAKKERAKLSKIGE